MLYLKACPKCHGDLVAEEFLPGNWELACLQCGHVTYRTVVDMLGMPVAIGLRDGVRRAEEQRAASAA